MFIKVKVDVVLKFAKTQATSALKFFKFHIGRHQQIKKAVSIVMNLFPGLLPRLIKVTSAETRIPLRPQNLPTGVTHLSTRARWIYTDLKSAIKKQQEKQN